MVQVDLICAGFVIVNGEKIEYRNNWLVLNNLNIKDIREIGNIVELKIKRRGDQMSLNPDIWREFFIRSI